MVVEEFQEIGKGIWHETLYGLLILIRSVRFVHEKNEGELKGSIQDPPWIVKTITVYEGACGEVEQEIACEAKSKVTRPYTCRELREGRSWKSPDLSFPILFF